MSRLLLLNSVIQRDGDALKTHIPQLQCSNTNTVDKKINYLYKNHKLKDTRWLCKFFFDSDAFTAYWNDTTVPLFINIWMLLEKKPFFYCSEYAGYTSQLNWVFIGTWVEKKKNEFLLMR